MGQSEIRNGREFSIGMTAMMLRTAGMLILVALVLGACMGYGRSGGRVVIGIDASHNTVYDNRGWFR